MQKLKSLEQARLDGEPIYVIPPIEQQPEMSLRADMLAQSRDWGHTNLGLFALHQAGHMGEGVVVCVLDTGVDPNHEDLRAALLPSGHEDFTGKGSWSDGHGHGTHCSGIVLANGGNDKGIIGAAPLASLLIMKVLSDGGSGASSWIAAGIRAAADRGADILSLSLGGSQPDNLTRQAIQYAIGKGCWVVCAAGNDGGPANSYPGHYPESIAVCATTSSDQRASFSTINGENDISAPGVSILSTLPQNRYGTMSGTSMATPYIAGCLALVRGAIKRLAPTMPTQAQVLTAFRTTAKDIPPSGLDSSTGWGLMGTRAMIDLFAGTPVPPPSPPVPPVPPPSPGGLTGKLVFVNGILTRVETP